MTVLLRALGLQAAYAVLQAMSPAVARIASVALLLTVNAVPLVALLNGDWGAGDVLIAYWLENVAVGIWALVKILTVSAAQIEGDQASGRLTFRVGGSPAGLMPARVARMFTGGFFTFHYGMFTLVHGVFTFILARRTEVTGSVRGFALMFLALLVSHGVSTWIYWFARGERDRVGLAGAMGQPYARIFVLHFAVIGSAWLLTSDSGPDLSSFWPGATTLGPGLLLIAIKVVVDVLAHLSEHRATSLPTRAAAPAR